VLTSRSKSGVACVSRAKARVHAGDVPPLLTRLSGSHRRGAFGYWPVRSGAGLPTWPSSRSVSGPYGAFIGVAEDFADARGQQSLGRVHSHAPRSGPWARLLVSPPGPVRAVSPGKPKGRAESLEIGEQRVRDPRAPFTLLSGCCGSAGSDRRAVRSERSRGCREGGPGTGLEMAILRLCRSRRLPRMPTVPARASPTKCSARVRPW
jgi:hypothetical protein